MRVLLGALLALLCAGLAQAQTATVGTAGGNKGLQAAYVGTSGGNKAVLNGYVGTASGNRAFFVALGVSISPSSAVANGSGPIVNPLTNTVTATPAGGTGPFTYAWSYVSGDSPAYFSISSATSATTQWNVAAQFAGGSATSVWRVVVTDTGTGNTAQATLNVTGHYSP